MSLIRVFQIALKGEEGKAPLVEEEWEILLGVDFFHQVVGIWEGVHVTIQVFFKAKTSFCKYRTSIKIEISMTCVYKEYEVKIKMVQEQWLHLKMKFLLVYYMKIFI